jgi:transposase
LIPQGVEIFVAVEPVDMRLGFERLGGLVRERMRREPRSKSALFVFFGKRRRTVKVLGWDGTGTVLWYNQPSSNYTSFGSRRGPWLRLRAWLAAARSLRRSQRLLCLVGRVAGSS